MSPAPVSGLLLGQYPERLQPPPGLAARHLRRMRGLLRRSIRRPADSGAPTTDTDTLGPLRARLARDPMDPATCEDALARVAVACVARLGLKPYPTQLQAARALLRGELVEMATGEGKTLAVGLAAACGALAGRPVHVITANDYLAQRDSEWLAPLYRDLGLSCAAVTSGSDRAARHAAYACSITYCPAREVVFDYLRDRLRAPRAATPLLARIAAMGNPAPAASSLLRGLWMAIVDEADSVLLDEALLPLVLSSPVDASESPAVLASALDHARSLAPGEQFTLDRVRRQARLTDRGLRQLRETPDPGVRYRTDQHRIEYIETALAALHLYQRDRDYLVRARSVQIIDEATGRAAPGRVWSRELHAFISLKEGCPPPPGLRPAAQITFQTFFPRYLHLCGTSGTLREERGELSTTYGLSVTRVPRRQPLRLERGRTRLFASSEAQRKAIVDRVRELCERQRPVLVAMDSVAEADALSQALDHRGIAHQLLHARQDRLESDLIARAGEAGRITVTTNIAGRGTDIRIDRGAEVAGGLHVIAGQHNRARRLDRQLAGRAARQGDPGSYERWVSVEQSLFAQTWGTRLARLIATRPLLCAGWCADRLLAIAQHRAERRARATRQALLARERDRRRELEIGPEP